MADVDLEEPVEELDIPGLTIQPVYYIRGPIPKHLRDRWPNYYVSDPPCAGNSTAVVLHGGRGSRVTILCPFTLQAYTVPNTAGEFGDGEELPLTRERVDYFARMITGSWHEFRAFGFQRDYDVAARALKLLGAEVPIIEDDGREDERPVRGKIVNARLTKPVRRDSRRGQTLEFFMEGPRSLLEAMAVLDMTRSGVLTHLHGLAVEHGLGYELRGDTASVILPPGCDDPFKGGDSRTKRSVKAEAGGVTEPVPEGTKRAAVARAASKGWRPVPEIAGEAGCTEASVRSHLHDLHAKHGVGFELSADRSRARILDPGSITYAEKKRRREG